MGFSVHQIHLFHQAMQEDLKQAHRLAEMYREQCITLETEVAQNREKGDVGREIFKVPWTDAHVFKTLIHISDRLLFIL